MSGKLSLRSMREWPRWTIIPLALGLAGLAVVLGLLLEPAADALSPEVVEPTPTMPAIAYSQGISDRCHDCHFSLPALETSAAHAGTAGSYLIEPESVVTPHGKLGCLACHGGDGEVQNKEDAHKDLVADMSVQDPGKCLICHQDLPDEIPNDRLRVPHGVIVERVEQGEPCGVHCSDCHGGVGHGFDPISGEKFCSMTVCVNCHEDLSLDIQMADCDACHLGPHDVAAALTCNDCHTSTETWAEVDLGIHPVSLLGKHGQTACFECHQYPDFKGLNNVCTDCHASGHANWGDHDCASCHDSGATWDVAALSWDGHAEHWDQYKGEHLKVACAGCHFEGYDGIDSNCESCHNTPSSHDEGRSEMDCVQCHQADQPWAAD